MWCRVMKCIAVCCNVMQCVNICRHLSVMQCVAVWCSVWIYVDTFYEHTSTSSVNLSKNNVTHCNTLQYTATQISPPKNQETASLLPRSKWVDGHKASTTLLAYPQGSMGWLNRIFHALDPMGWLRLVGSLKYRSLLQNIISFIGLFWKRDL